MTTTPLSHFDEKSGIVVSQTPFGRWHQTAHEVTVEVDLPEAAKGKEIVVKIKPSLLECRVRGELIFQVIHASLMGRYGRSKFTCHRRSVVNRSQGQNRSS